MNKFNFKNFIQGIFKDKLTITLCVFFSVILWISTILYNSDSYSVIKIKNVPIISNLANTQAEQLGLSVVKTNPKNINVYVRGPRHKISFIKKEDVVVVPKTYSNIISSGSYNLELNAYLKKPQQNVYIESLSHKSADFCFDVLETKTINLVANNLDVGVEEGFIKDEAVCQPSSLFVSGPKQYIDKLSSIKLFVNAPPCTLNSSKTFDATPKFLSENGDVIDSSVFKYNKDVKFNVTVPVYNVKKVPLTVLFKNAPEKLNLDLLKARIEPKEIEIGGAQDTIKNINEINVGYVDLREFNEDKKNFNFNITLPQGVKNINQISSANVYLNRHRLDSKYFSVKGIELLNVPGNFSVVVNSKKIQGVKVVGYKEYLKKIEAENLTATVDCSGLDLKEGMQNVPVKIGVIKDGVWPVGEYKCPVTVKKKWNYNIYFVASF